MNCVTFLVGVRYARVLNEINYVYQKSGWRVSKPYRRLSEYSWLLYPSTDDPYKVCWRSSIPCSFLSSQSQTWKHEQWLRRWKIAVKYKNVNMSLSPFKVLNANFHFIKKRAFLDWINRKEFFLILLNDLSLPVNWNKKFDFEKILDTL